MDSSEQQAESSRPAYDTLMHKLARAGRLQLVVKALIFAPVPAGMAYAASGASYGEEVNIARPIGIAHLVFFAVALVLFGGMLAGPGLTANIRSLNTIRQSELAQYSPRNRASIASRNVMIVWYAVLAIPMLIGMGLGDVVGSELVRWVSTGVGWVVFGATALFIRHATNLAARQRAMIGRPAHAPGAETIPPPDVTTAGQVESPAATPGAATTPPDLTQTRRSR